MLRVGASTPSEAAVPQLTEDDIWHYARGNDRKGPVSVATLKHLAEAGVVTHTTLVWREGLDNWVEVRDVPELQGRIDV